MTQKDLMLREVLNNEELMSYYRYTMEDVDDYDDVYEAQNASNAIIAAVARIIKELDGSTDPNKQNEVYKKLFTYLNNNLIL